MTITTITTITTTSKSGELTTGLECMKLAGASSARTAVLALCPDPLALSLFPYGETCSSTPIQGVAGPIVLWPSGILALWRTRLLTWRPEDWQR